jgi:Zn-dependent protease
MIDAGASLLSTITHAAIRICPNCGADLPLEALACPACHALVHSVRLDQLARDARALEARGSFAQAGELWAYSLTLLPHDSKQAAWVKDRLNALQAAQNGSAESVAIAAATPAPDALSHASPSTSNSAGKPGWVKKLGPLGPFALLLLKLKTVLLAVFKLKFLFSFVLFIGLYVGLFGWRYGLGISAAILIHEMGHYIDIKRRGLPAEMPVFLPGLGAYVKWTGLGVTPRQIAQISLAGPLAGWIAAAVCFLLYAQNPAAPNAPLWAALARTGAVLNTLNLIPVWVLDGGKAINPLGMVERATLLATTLGLWFYTGEGIFFLVAAGICWRLFTAWRSPDDNPQQPGWSTWAYYAAVLIALAVMLHATPNTLVNQINQAARP